MFRIHSQQDLAAGLFLILLASLGLAFAADLPMGRAMRMGPGYLPVVLSCLLGGLGLIIAARSLAIQGPRLQSWAWRPLLTLTCALLVFAALLERGGLALSVLASVAVSSLAAPGARALPVLALALVLAVGSAGLFIFVLNLPLILWPRLGG